MTQYLERVGQVNTTMREEEAAWTRDNRETDVR